MHNLQHTANAQNRGIQQHPQENCRYHLHLLHIIGASCDQRCCRELIHFCTGELHHAAEYLAAEVASDTGTHAGCHIAHTDGSRHHCKCHSHHFSAGAPEVAGLNFIHIQAGILVTLYRVGHAHGLHQGIAHGVQHLFQLRTHLSYCLFAELTTLLHCCKQRPNIHTGHCGFIAVIVLFGTLERFQFHTHGCADIRNGHLLHLLCGVEVGLLLRQHLAEAVLIHHGHLIVEQNRYYQIAVQFVQILFRQICTAVFSVIGILPLLFLYICHEKLCALQLSCRNLFRQDMRHTAVLDSDIDDIGGVLGQRQVTKRLHRQQHNDDQNRFPIRFQVFKKFPHRDVSLLSYMPPLRPSSHPVPRMPPYRAGEADP